jgi:hypothetical protein
MQIIKLDNIAGALHFSQVFGLGHVFTVVALLQFTDDAPVMPRNVQGLPG